MDGHIERPLLAVCLPFSDYVFHESLSPACSGERPFPRTVPTIPAKIIGNIQVAVVVPILARLDKAHSGPVLRDRCLPAVLQLFAID